MTSEKRSPARARLARGLLVSAAFLALFEGSLRLAGFEGPPPGYFFLWGGDRWSPVFRTDPAYLWALKPDLRAVGPEAIWAETNSRGLRGPEVSPLPPEGTRRVLCLGDSVTAGGYSAWPLELGRVLREASPETRVEVVNAGVPAYSSFQVLRFYEDALEDLRADFVLAMVGFNDRAPAPLPDAERAVRGKGVAVIHRTLERLRTFRLVRAAARRLLRGTPRGPVGPRVALPEFRANLARLAALVRERGAVPVFLTEPWFEGPGPALVPAPHAAYGEAMREIAKEGAVLVIDLAGEWREGGAGPLFDGTWEAEGRSPVFSDRIHPNDLGFRLIGETVARRLIGEGLLPGRAPPPGPALVGVPFAITLADLDDRPGDEIAAAIHDGERLRLRWFSIEGERLGEAALEVDPPRGSVAAVALEGKRPSLALGVGGPGGRLLVLGPDGEVEAERPFEGEDPALVEVGTDGQSPTLLVSGRLGASLQVDRLDGDLRTRVGDFLPVVRGTGAEALSMAGGRAWPGTRRDRFALSLRRAPPSPGRGLIGFYDRDGNLERTLRAFFDNPGFSSTRLAAGRSGDGRPLLLAARGGAVKVFEGPAPGETRGWRVVTTLFPFGFSPDSWEGAGLALSSVEGGKGLWIVLGRESGPDLLRFDPATRTMTPVRTYGR